MKLAETHDKLIKACLDTSYYPGILYDVMGKYPSKLCSDRQIVNFWNDFWLSLPDTPVIRKSPLFYQVCDIAEMIFDSDYE